jgi:penicillin amidase/acyl-homoserine-lactone acylase
MANMRGEPKPDPKESLKAAADFLMKHFGQLDPEYGELNRLVRGGESWPIAGGPDTLRAVYGELDEDAGILGMTAGDSYIMFVRWDAEGVFTARTVHSFGSATLDVQSPHYSDQSPLFAAEKERVLPLSLDTVLAEKTSDITLGARNP